MIVYSINRDFGRVLRDKRELGAKKKPTLKAKELGKERRDVLKTRRQNKKYVKKEQKKKVYYAEADKINLSVMLLSVLMIQDLSLGFFAGRTLFSLILLLNILHGLLRFFCQFVCSVEVLEASIFHKIQIDTSALSRSSVVYTRPLTKISY